MSNLNIVQIIDNINKSSKSINENLKFIQNMLRLVEGYLRESSDRKVLFSEFSDLSILMNLLAMNGENQFEYITSFVEENLNTNMIEQPDLKVLHMDVDTYNKIEIIASAYSISLTPTIMSRLYDRYLQHKPLGDFEQKIIDLMVQSFQTLEEFRGHMLSIKESYLDKKDSYTMDDILNIVNTLQDMKVEHESCEKIRKYLVQQYKVRMGIKTKKVETLKPIFAIDNGVNKKKNASLTSKQYKKLRDELEEVISFATMQVKRELSQEERILFASKLLLIGRSKEEVNKFLSNSDSMYQFVLAVKKILL